MIGDYYFECECSDGVYTVTARKKGRYTAFVSYFPEGFFPGSEYYEFEDRFEFRNREDHRPYFFILDERDRLFITADKHVPVGESRSFADLGPAGLPSGRGYIRPGKLYITDELAADMATVEAVRELGIQTIIDLSDPQKEGYVKDIQYDGVRMLPEDQDMYDAETMFADICFKELREGRRILIHSGPGGEDPVSFVDRIITIFDTDGEEGTTGSAAVSRDISEIRSAYLIWLSDDTATGEAK
ncbi:MAG: hypothetical protein IKE27_06730 [Oscillospiraceae bacterium]|nr:hypothetical protein [Oscillospiraceae bacterium]